MKKIFTLFLMLIFVASYAQKTTVQTQKAAKDAHVVFSEDFDGALPDTWEAVLVAGPVNWSWTTEGGAYGGQLASTTASNGYMMLDSDGEGTGADEEADLITPAMDLTNVSGEILFTVEHIARTFGLAECRIYISADNFDTQEMLYEWEGAADNEWNTTDGVVPDPRVIVSTFDISDYAGEANVKIKFNWIGSYDYWWLLDDILITGTISQVETYEVTFNVDLTGVEGFDPALNDVFLTGNFTGWAVPGTEGSVQLTLVENPGKDAHIVFSEDFDGALPDTWEAVLVAGPVNWSWTTEGGAYGGQLASTTASNGYMMLDSDGEGTGADEEADLITPAMDLTNVSGEILFTVEHIARTFGLAECRIYISADNFDTQEMLYEWEGAADNEWNTTDGVVPDPRVIVSTFDISEYAGEANVKIKFNWIGSYDYWWLLDDVVITGTITDTPEELIYTTTVEIEAGEILYKYFSDAFGAGWDGGEWAGDPNRSFMVEANAVLNDIWGQQPDVSVDEIQLDMVTRVYPNPVRNTLFIQSQQQIDHMRLFDLAGRLVFQTQVMGFETTIDASQMNGGLYILQLISGQQVKTHKIQVVK